MSGKQKKIVRVSTKQVLERARERWPQAGYLFIRQTTSHKCECGKYRIDNGYELGIYRHLKGDELFRVYTGSLETMLKKIEAAP